MCIGGSVYDILFVSDLKPVVRFLLTGVSEDFIDVCFIGEHDVVK